MAKQRMINTKMWEDGWFCELDPIEKLFFIYLLTNPMTNILGVYELSKGTISRATGLESRVVDEILTRFEKAKKVYYIEGRVVLVNFIKHQNYRSPKVVAGLLAELENIPKNIVKIIKPQLERYGIDTISHSNTNTNSNSNSNLIPEVIKLFETINPTCKTYYGNTTQRGAVDFLLNTHGFERVEKVVKELLPVTNGMEFMPTITTPVQLRDKWSALEAAVKRQKIKSKKTVVW